MPGLSDIARSFRTVKVGNTDVEVPGISAEGIAYLFHRFPIIKDLIGGKPNLEAEDLIKIAPEALAAIIAVGTGSMKPEDEAVAAKLGAESQLALLEAIVKETMPGGVGPFVEKLSALFQDLGVESISTQDGTSPSPSKR